MTSRLKRKLGDLGVDTSSSKANESFCLIGTPLPPLEKSKDTGEFVPLWKQEVRDEKGRRRLHGAFTGGFSAGYFNTVGSKEGWAPSTFVSSRSDRAKQKAARPEDFMDEEDLTELKDSQKLVDTNEEMDFIGGTQAELQQRGEPEKDSFASALEASLLPPARESVGARILKKMGWRLGHGIGPKITWEKRKRQSEQSSNAPTAPDEMEDEEASKHLYPPRDTKVPAFSRKDNSHGLGYVPGAGLTEIVAGNAKQSGGPNLSSGFGLGALNDAEEDDLDVYDGGFTQGSSRLAYEDEVDDGEKIIMGVRNKALTTSNKQRKSGPQSTYQTFHDGHPVLAGFLLSERPLTEDKWFPLPDIPKDWTPNPRRVWEKDKENMGDLASDTAAAASHAPANRRSWKTGITADQRGSMLGETPLPAAPRSVFDYLAPKDRERLKNMASGELPTAESPDPAPTPGPPASARIEPQIAKAALHGFQPFTADPVKQARYTAYLRAQAAMEDVPLTRAAGQDADAFARELADYAKAARLFRPVSGSMASRFTSAAIVEQGPPPQTGLHAPEPAPAPATEEKAEESAKEHAARMGMFGPLTRETRAWQPAKLLCKRFGVRDPHPEPAADEAATAVNQGASSTSGASAGWRPEQELTGGSASAPVGVDAGKEAAPSRSGGRPSLANIGLGDDDTQGKDTLTYERPAKDIFKAIFASDDEDSDEEEQADAQNGDGQAAESVPAVAPAASTSTATVASKSAPEHLAVASPTVAVYSPESHESSKAAAPVDMNSFKPTFIPRADREKNKANGKDRVDKKEKKKKHGKAALVSFEVDDEGNADVKDRATDKKESSKKKKKRKERPVDEEDDSMWVEKPLPEVVQELSSRLEPPQVSPTPSIPASGDDVKEVGPPRGRKRAIDFM